MACHNCMGCCIHSKVEEKTKKIVCKDDNGVVLMIGFEHEGYQHYCDKNPDGYDKWHEEHKHDTYDTYKDSTMDCYEPTESARLMEEMIDLGNKIMDKH